jgi:AcrR family transcriptional regulator
MSYAGGMTTGARARAGGRRPGATTTREEILEAARHLFATRGYDATTIRGIATSAGVDPALVHHFFGSKDELFLTVLQVPETVLSQVPALLGSHLETAGERLVRFFLGLFESPDTRAAILTTLRSAVTQESAARILRETITAHLFAGIRDLLPDRPEVRMTLAMSHLNGLAVGRYVLAVPPLADMDLDDVVAWVAPAVQRYLTGPAPA